MQRQADILRAEHGFSLVELLIGMTLGVIVLVAILTVLINYQQDAGRTHRQLDAQANARVAVDRIVRELRSVASSRTNPTLIESASPYDLTFQTVGTASGSNTAGIKRVRYCVPADPVPGGSANQVLTVQTETWNTSTVPANPWAPTSGVYPSCPSTPGSLPGGAAISTNQIASNVMNRRAGADRPAFTFTYGTAGDLATITNVGVELFIDIDPTRSPEETSLRSAAFLRNQNQPPVASFTATATGGGHLLLNGGGSSDGDGSTLTYAWTNVTGGANTALADTGFYDWSPGAGTYSVKLTVTDPGGLSATQTQTVVVQ
jgi:prepilin-type N-terminal cleavage/methylation domain-containing protein